MIICPKCQSTLPDWATTCQFCQTDVAKVARPVAAPTQKRVYGYGPAPWVWVAYYGIAVWWALLGLYDVISGVVGIVNPPKVDALSMIDMSFLGYIMVALGFATMVIGVGLLFRAELIRGIVNIFCWLRIVGGARRALWSFGAIMVWPAMGVFLLVVSLFDIVSAGLMIYLIGETEKSAPNL